MDIENLLRPVEILLVDDNPGDVRLMMEALRQAQIIDHVIMAEDGAETLKILHRENGYSNINPSDLILLDLNLPKTEGQEVLTEIKNDPNLSRIPVVIVTSTSAPQESLRAYRSEASCYITKPLDLGQFISTVNAIDNFSYTVVHLPTE